MRRAADTRGLRYHTGFVRTDERAQAVAWLRSITPLWEQRWSTVRPPPAGEAQRPLLRPVYWLGAWQFACLGYYHPPTGTHHRAVAAEPFPPVLARWVARAEATARTTFPAAWIPDGWRLNTCLVNLYGDALVDGRREDRARVGDHRDFEPGPVASVSLGSRAYFQFVTRGGAPVHETWLDDGSLLVFAGPHWKDRALHRVQRVDRKGDPLPPEVVGFTTRRVNFTFRWVPDAHVAPLAALPDEARRDVEEYARTLALTSPFWADAVSKASGPA